MALWSFWHFWGDVGRTQTMGAIFAFLLTAVWVCITAQYVRTNEDTLAPRRQGGMPFRSRLPGDFTPSEKVTREGDSRPPKLTLATAVLLIEENV